MSIGNERRQAPVHFFMKANNARFCAFVLSNLEVEQLRSLAEPVGYGEDVNIATCEGFRREAVIAQKNQNARRNGEQKINNVPMNHDVVQLWSEARLEVLPDDDQYRLVLVKSLLNWSSRYAAPRKDKTYEDEKREFEPFNKVIHEFRSGLKITSGHSFNFQDFDRLFQIAADRFWLLRSKLD